jgi:hypothetical protein
MKGGPVASDTPLELKILENRSKNRLQILSKNHYIILPFSGSILGPDLAGNLKIGILKIAVSHETSLENRGSVSKCSPKKWDEKSNEK